MNTAVAVASSRLCSEVFTMVRYDLLDLHLQSIDHPTRHVFVVFNYADDQIKERTVAMLDKYKGCGGGGGGDEHEHHRAKARAHATRDHHRRRHHNEAGTKHEVDASGEGTSQAPPCANPHVRQLHVLPSARNVGFAGSVNTGIKAMVEYNLPYAVFSGDDTRFRPGRLAVAKRLMVGGSMCVGGGDDPSDDPVGSFESVAAPVTSQRATRPSSLKPS